MANMNTSDDVLRCPITLEIFRDPVLAPDGCTYEKQNIEEWIRNNGTSPMTRQPLSIEQLYPNRAVKELVDTFETLLRQKHYRFTLDVDVKKKKGRPIFQTIGKTIYGAEWLPNNNNRPEIILLKIDSTRAEKEASFYVNLCRHPHIIRTFGFVYDRNIPDQNNSILLLQEYAPEGSLYDLLQERPTVCNERILIPIFLQIVDAMICLVSNHVIHGDLACRNVLVFRFDDNHPEMNVVKVTDFGLSRHSQLYSRTPGAGRTVLTIVPVRYAAPEVLASSTTSEVYTEKSDVYSMGVLMWEAYSRGALPWINIEDDNAVIERVRNGCLLSQPPNCSDRFWSIMKKVWSTSPSDRPTFSQLKNLLSEQYYRSDLPFHNNSGQYNMNINHDLAERTRNQAQRQQEVEDRKIAEQYALSEQRRQQERIRPVTQTVSPEARPPFRFQPTAQKYDRRSTNNNASQPRMEKQELVKTLMQMMMAPSRSSDGRLMDEDGYYNEDGSRSFS